MSEYNALADHPEFALSIDEMLAQIVDRSLRPIHLKLANIEQMTQAQTQATLELLASVRHLIDSQADMSAQIAEWSEEYTDEPDSGAAYDSVVSYAQDGSVVRVDFPVFAAARAAELDEPGDLINIPLDNWVEPDHPDPAA